MMRKLTEYKSGYIIELGTLEYFSVSEAFDFAFTHNGLGEGRGVSLNPLLYDLVKKNIVSVINDNETNGRYEAERLLLGYLNLYGIIPVEKFQDLVIDSLLDAHDDVDLVINMFHNGLTDIFRYDDGMESYLFSPCIQDIDKLMEYKKSIDFKKNNYQIFSREQAYSAGFGSPYCNFNLETPAGRNLLDILTTLGYETSRIETILHEIWLNSQYTTNEDNAETIFNCISDKQEEIGGFQYYKECVDAIVEYVNNLPKWALNGFSSEEANQLKIVIKVLDESENGDKDFFLSAEEKAGVQSASGLSDFFKYGMAVKHVAPDDPCPCGSGLSYKFCHGKRLS